MTVWLQGQGRKIFKNHWERWVWVRIWSLFVRKKTTKKIYHYELIRQLVDLGVSAGVYMCICACVCVEARGRSHVFVFFFFQVLSVCGVRVGQDLSTTWNSPSRLSWLASLKDPPAPASCPVQDCKCKPPPLAFFILHISGIKLMSYACKASTSQDELCQATKIQL